MEIKKIDDPDQIEGLIEVVKSAWGFENPGNLVKDVIAAMRYHGGIILGAYEDSKMVGMHFSFPGYKNGKLYLYSHMTGVVEDHKYSGLGHQLKMAQKTWALDNGYDLIAWTFDPLMSLNANFNIHKLGTVSRTYLNNFYGKMSDSLNFGFPTDRLVAEWWIAMEKDVEYGDYAFVNDISMTDGVQKFVPLEHVYGNELALRIPLNYVEVKKKNRDFAMEWRMETRNIFRDLFGRGYMIVDFLKDEKSGYYVLKKDVEYPYQNYKNIFI